MIRVLVVSALAFAAAGLAACSHNHHHAAMVAAQSAANACAAAVQQHQNLIGMDAGAIDESTLPANHRVVCFGCGETMDYDASRFTVYVGPGHKVASVHCG